jgi:hypothetical protein
MAQNTPGQQLFDLLVTRGFDPETLDSSGKAAPTAEDAEIYSFEFVSSGGTNYGTVVIMLGDDKQLELFSGDNVGRGMDSKDKTEWYDFQHQLKNFATKNFMTFGSQNINRLKYSMQGQAALKEGLFESWNGTKNVSWNGGPDSVRLMIRHKRPMGVNEARFRQVESLFLETAEGERYKLPFRNLAGGRAMVEHVRQGGRPYDMRGQHIANMVEELNVLSRFRRASLGRVFEGDTANLVSETNQYHATMSRTLKGLASARGYNTYFESWNPADITEQDVIIEDIKTLFVQETIDSRIEQALPIMARIQQQGTAMKEANIFEAWAENLLEGTWATPNTPEQQQELIELLSQELPVGADATNATEQLYSLVGDDILFDQLQDLAEQDANADCRNLVIARIKDMSNKGFEDFEPVLDALRSTQLAPATVAPAAPAAPVAEEVSAEAKYDPTDDDSHDYGTDLLFNIRMLYIYARDGRDTRHQIASLKNLKDGIEQSEEPRLIQCYDYLMKNLAGGTVTDPKMIMQIADKAHQLYHPSLEPIAQATREAVDDEEYSVDGGMNNELLQDGMLGSIVGGIGGAALTKSPGGAMAGAKLGSAAQDAFGEESITPDPKYDHEPPAQESDPIPDDSEDDPIPDDQGDDQDTIARLQELAGIGSAMSEGNGDTEIRPGMRVSQGTVVKVDGNTVTVKTSNGDMMTMNIHDVDQGVMEGQEDSPVASAITRRILMQRSDLLSKYGPEKVTAAIDEVADFVGDTDEIGSSDVSGWIKQVEQMLGNTAEEVAVTTGNPPLGETTALQGQYGHSGKLQTFDDVEEDVLHRLRELSGMIRS